MSKSMKRVLLWTPRVLGILFAIFISLFALDVFAEGYTLGEMLIAFTMHMIPTALVLVALALAWRWEWLGGLLFIGLGVYYIVMAGGRVHWAAYLAISGPLFLIGAWFLYNWTLREELHAAV